MSEDVMRQNLVAIAQAFATAKGWSLATVSKRFHGNQAFLNAYLAGEVSPTIRTYYAMVERMRAEWPADAQWPKTSAIPKLGKKVH